MIRSIDLPLLPGNSFPNNVSTALDFCKLETSLCYYRTQTTESIGATEKGPSKNPKIMYPDKVTLLELTVKPLLGP